MISIFASRGGEKKKSLEPAFHKRRLESVWLDPQKIIHALLLNLI